VAIEVNALASLLRGGRNRRASESSVISDLGYLTGLWNGDFDQSVGLSITCGSWSPRLLNAIVLNLPNPAGRAVVLVEPATAKALVQVMVDAWDPDWAMLGTNTLRSAQHPQPRQPVVGWLTYLAGDRPRPDALPDGVTMEPMGRGGVLVALTPRFEDATPALARETAETLDAAGALRSIA